MSTLNEYCNSSKNLKESHNFQFYKTIFINIHSTIYGNHRCKQQLTAYMTRKTAVDQGWTNTISLTHDLGQ